MSKSKSNSRSAAPSGAVRVFVAVHQDHLMEAFARGFVSRDGEPFAAETVVTQGALDRAMGSETWGSVVLLELLATRATHHDGAFAVPQPLILSDCHACWTPSDDVAAEIDARLHTFDDTIPSALEVKVDQALFPRESATPSPDPEAKESLSLPFAEPAPEASEVGDIAMAADIADFPDADIDATTLEKLAGAIALIRWRSSQLQSPIELVSDLIAVPDLGAGHGSEGDALERFAMHVHGALRKDEASTADARIFAAAASLLHGITPKEGIEPLGFARTLETRLRTSSENPSDTPDVKAFVETIKKIIDNRIELNESKIDDSGKIGQRALMVFLLAPKAEQLQRWIGARRDVGKDVSLLANVLSGLYCGLGSIPREVKGPGRSPFIAATVAASSIASGRAPMLESSRVWSESASLRERLTVSGHELLERTKLPAPALADVLVRIRRSGRPLEVNATSGEITVAFEKSDVSPVASIRVGASAYRLPAAEVLALTFKVKPLKRGQLSRQLLEDLMAGSMAPVVARIAAPDCIELTVEVDLATDANLGLEALVAAARKLELVPAEEAKTKPRPTNASSRKTALGSKAKTSAKDPVEGA